MDFDELDFQFITNWIFTPCVACKNPVRNRLKIQFIELHFSNSIFQKSSVNQQGDRMVAAKLYCRVFKFLVRFHENPFTKNLQRVYQKSGDLEQTKHCKKIFAPCAQTWTSSYWTAKSSFFFLTSDQHEGGNLGPKLHPGGGFFGP